MLIQFQVTIKFRCVAREVSRFWSQLVSMNFHCLKIFFGGFHSRIASRFLRVFLMLENFCNLICRQEHQANRLWIPADSKYNQHQVHNTPTWQNSIQGSQSRKNTLEQNGVHRIKFRHVALPKVLGQYKQLYSSPGQLLLQQGVWATLTTTQALPPRQHRLQELLALAPLFTWKR